MDEPEQLDEWLKVNVLGSGSFGIVTLWIHTRTREKVAIKKCRIPDQNLEQKYRDRWTKEVERMKEIQNDNIVSFEKLPKSFENELLKYNPSNLPMLSMEYCSCGDLRKWLSKAENCCGFKEYEVRYIISDIMNAVSYLHKLEITHRDLKPENIVLKKCDRRNRIIYKLIDLGYAKEIGEKSVSASFVGTLQYLAPELIYSKTYSCSVDYWSFGVLAFEVICGIRPFLPNENVSKWMFEVHKKQSDVICIYENHEKKLIFEKEMYSSNNISSCFKQEIEKWLRIALEYQPRKRGYINDPNKKNQLVIFSLLETILKKKFVNVFVVYTLETYTYEIDNCTLVSTLQGWIAIDTKIQASEQILLSDCCENITMNGLVEQFFDETYTNIMLFVFKKGTILMDTIKLETPQMLEKYMEVDLLAQNIYFQRRTFSMMLHFILRNINKYNILISACALKLKRMCQNTHNNCVNMNVEMDKLLARCDYARELLDIDLHHYSKNFKQNATHWFTSFKNILENIQIVDNARKTIYNKGEALCRRIQQMSSAFHDFFSKREYDLNTTLKQAINKYYNVVDKMRNRDYIEQDGREFLKLFYDFFKAWKAHMEKDETFRHYLSGISDTEKDMEKVNLTIETAISNIHKYQKEILEDHKNRQNKVWEFTIKQKPKPKTVPSPPDMLTQAVSTPTNFILGKNDSPNIKQASSFNNTQQTNYNSLTPEKTFKSCPIMNSSHKADMSPPITELLETNNNLMQQIEEKMKEGYKQFEETFDFSCLNDKI